MFPYFFWDPTMLLLIPGIILAMYAQAKVQSTFHRYSQVPSRNGWTGAQLARDLLYRHHLDDVKVEMVHGSLSDHYDPRRKVLRLSPEVYHSTSLAALGVAAHEVGHVMQHHLAYIPFRLRSAIVPLASIGSTAAFPLLILGLLMGSRDLVLIGVLAFSLAVLFQLVTLPVEYNASSRAMEALVAGDYVYRDEVGASRKVLNAAALTYVAATLMAVLQLLRLLLLSGLLGRGRRRD
ncbi:MAG: zinc metallopeptidase [Clostridia bacterium]|jgi:Zn-dependent membrane protease YugP